MTEVQLANDLAGTIGQILSADVNPTAMDAKLEEDYGANSMDIVDIAERIERQFGIEITNDEISLLKTFGDAVKLVHRKTKK